jgi:hypothetical protein
MSYNNPTSYTYPQHEHYSLALTGNIGALRTRVLLYQVRENSDVGTFVAHLSVVDADSGDNGRCLCAVDDRHFSLEQLYPTELKLITAAVLDRERRDTYDLTISCRDFGTIPLTSTVPLRVKVRKDSYCSLAVYSTLPEQTCLQLKRNYVFLKFEGQNGGDRKRRQLAAFRRALVNEQSIRKMQYMPTINMMTPLQSWVLQNLQQIGTNELYPVISDEQISFSCVDYQFVQSESSLIAQDGATDL